MLGGKVKNLRMLYRLAREYGLRAPNSAGCRGARVEYRRGRDSQMRSGSATVRSFRTLPVLRVVAGSKARPVIVFRMQRPVARRHGESVPPSSRYSFTHISNSGLIGRGENT
jgi:hypothetical protein